MTPGTPLNHAVAATPSQHSVARRSGVALAVDASRMLGSETVAQRFLGQLTGTVASGVPTALRVTNLGPAAEAPAKLQDVCCNIRTAFAGAGVDTRLLELTVDAATLLPYTAWHIRRSVLGDGRLNVVIGTPAMDAALQPQASDAFWLQLWHLRSTKVVSAFWPSVRSRCALLSPEPARDILPRLGLQAPRQSAWLFGEFDLPAFADASGAVRLSRLAGVLEAFVEAAESAYDTSAWATPAMNYDAWYNRRLAVCIAGIGDIVKRRRLDPEDHATLREIGALLAGIRRIVEKRSRSLSRGRECLPSIAATNPCLRLGNESRTSCWQNRWTQTLERTAQRHRNLLVMSPWSVFPENDADFRYANLLPLLAHADACTFRRRLPLAHWSARQFMHFHCRTWAVSNAVERSTVVAEQP